MSNPVRRVLNGCANFTRIPQVCALCGGYSGRALLCAACHADLPHHSGPQCPVCAEVTANGEVCGACIARPPAFRQTHAALRYAYPADSLVRQYKYGGRLALAGLFASLLAERLQGFVRPDVLVPMPLHPTRLRERGFNQAWEIAKPLGARLDVAVSARLCARVRATAPQADLSRRERRANLRGAFACERTVAGVKVAVLDDVMTSGASARVLARALVDAGAAVVTVWVVARAVRD